MVLLIAHRGNTHGPKPEYENAPDYIDAAISKGFDVEVDVWFNDGQLSLGHDFPQYKISETFLFERAAMLWCHAKNLEALIFLTKKSIHTFSHDKDDYVLTSKGVIWAYPGKSITAETICVMPERACYSLEELIKCRGVCSDLVSQIRLEIFGRA
jgi:sulfur transfer complex TusBCD TusB component (DsrH family)